ncbi:MAG: GntR family transcriptional regulator [Pseudomonadota bacterium]
MGEPVDDHVDSDLRTRDSAGQAMATRPVSLSGPIYDTLRQRIIDLDIYHPATPLRMDERGLAEAFGISRTPVRAAIHRLEQDGFVETLPRRGVFIRRRSLPEILEMVEMWGALEAAAARIACARAEDAAIASVRDSVAQFGEQASKLVLSEYSEANIAFHRSILALSGNSMMIAAGEGLLAHLAAVRRRAMADPSRTEGSLTDHSGIVAALEAREADLAARRVEAHTAGLHVYLSRNWKTLTGDAAGAAMATVPRPQTAQRPSGDAQPSPSGGGSGAAPAGRVPASPAT